MKLRICRLSGGPFDIKAYRKEFAEAYDRLEIDNKAVNGSMEQFSHLLEDVETELRTKYGIESVVDLPKNAKQWHALVEQNGPVMVAKSQANQNELVLIIIDMPIG